MFDLDVVIICVVSYSSIFKVNFASYFNFRRGNVDNSKYCREERKKREITVMGT